MNMSVVEVRNAAHKHARNIHKLLTYGSVVLDLQDGVRKIRLSVRTGLVCSIMVPAPLPPPMETTLVATGVWRVAWLQEARGILADAVR
jgi:hypothetical protein